MTSKVKCAVTQNENEILTRLFREFIGDTQLLLGFWYIQCLVRYLQKNRQIYSVSIKKSNPSTLFLFFSTNHWANFNKFFRNDRIHSGIFWNFPFCDVFIPPAPPSTPTKIQNFKKATIWCPCFQKYRGHYFVRDLWLKKNEKPDENTKIYDAIPINWCFFAKMLDNVGRSD